ncbi:MAG: hypothetical protein GY828_02935 [Candidatus Gracilibacteria bacterium]|nr:hypothetical protein [Candidatus Gracilibacteria bacterium]
MSINIMENIDLSLLFRNQNSPSLSESLDYLDTFQSMESPQLVEIFSKHVSLILQENEEGNTSPETKNIQGEIQQKCKLLFSHINIPEELQKYPLTNIHWDLLRNSKKYSGNNKYQIDITLKYGIESFKKLEKIVEALGLSDILSWSNIHMKMDRFEEVVDKINIRFGGSISSSQELIDLAEKVVYNNVGKLYDVLKKINIISNNVEKIHFSLNDISCIRANVFQLKKKNKISGANLHQLHTNRLSQEDFNKIYESFIEIKRQGTHGFYREKYLRGEMERILHMDGYNIIGTKLSSHSASA